MTFFYPPTLTPSYPHTPKMITRELGRTGQQVVGQGAEGRARQGVGHGGVGVGQLFGKRKGFGRQGSSRKMVMATTGLTGGVNEGFGSGRGNAGGRATV